MLDRLFGFEFRAAHFAITVAIVYGAALTVYVLCLRDLLKRERDWTAILMRLLNGQYDQLRADREEKPRAPGSSGGGRVAGVVEVINADGTAEVRIGGKVAIDIDERMRQVADQIRADQRRHGRETASPTDGPPPLPTIPLTQPIPLVTPVSWLVRRLTGSGLPRYKLSSEMGATAPLPPVEGQ